MFQKKGFPLEPRYTGMYTFSTKKLRHWHMQFKTPARAILFLYQDTIRDSRLISISMPLPAPNGYRWIFIPGLFKFDPWGFIVYNLQIELFCWQLSQVRKTDFEGPEKRTFSFDPPNISSGSLPKTQKTESILAKLGHKNSHEGFNIKFEMTLSPQETR
jgi:hypothetical protein